MSTADHTPTFKGPWFCVLDREFKLVYLGTDALQASADAAATPGAVKRREPRMGDAMKGATLDVAAARRRKGAA